MIFNSETAPDLTFVKFFYQLHLKGNPKFLFFFDGWHQKSKHYLYQR